MSFKDQVLKEATKIPSRWLGLHLAQRALGVQDVQRQLATGAKREAEAWEALKSMTGTKPTSEQPSSEDEVGDVIVGDQQTTVYNMAAPQPNSTLGKFAKAAMLGAALLGAGGTGAVATAWLCGLFDKAKPAVQKPIEFPEQDGYGLKIFEDDEDKTT